MKNRALVILVSLVALFQPSLANQALDDSYAFRAAKIHDTPAAYRSYLKNCSVCSFREDAARKLDGVSEPVIVPTMAVVESVRIAPTVAVTPSTDADTQPLKLVVPGEQSALLKTVHRVQVSLPSKTKSKTKSPVRPQYFAAASRPAAPRSNSRLLQGHSRTVWSVAYDPSGSVLASGGADQQIRLWPLAEGGASRQLSGHKSYISALDFSANGEFLASVSGDRSVRLWKNGRTSRVLNHATGEVSAVSFTSDSRRVISGSEDSTLRLWDVQSGQLQQSLGGHKSGVLAIAMSPFGDEFASSDATGSVLLWKLGKKSEQKARRKLQIFAHSGMAYDVKYAHNGQQLFTAGADGLVNQWHRSGARARVFAGHRSDVTALAVHPSGSWLISGGRDQSVRVWSLRTGQQTAFFSAKVGEVYSLALSPSGKRLAVSGTGEAVQLIELDLPSGQRG